MIDYLLTAFFLAQPLGAAATATATAPRSGTASPRLQAPVEISSRRVTGSRDQATFSGDVVVKQRTLDLRCDEMTASYTGPREVTRVECQGNMRLVDGERTAQGERAVLDVPTGALVVTGQPEARDTTTRLRGSQMRLVMGAPPGFEYEVDDATVTLEAAPLTLAHKPGAKDAPGARLPAEITARRVIGSRTQAVFTGDVVAKHRTLDLRCDKMIATYTAAREVTRAECVGHVRATDGDRQVKGERAIFRVPTGLLVVTGNPEARDATTHLKGSEVRMTVGDANFEVRDAVVTVESAKAPSTAPTPPPAGGTRKP